jgi:hypothetical protein
MLKLILIFLMWQASPANAEVFKCKSTSGEIIYQSNPCPIGEKPVGQLKIKAMTPQEIERAKALRQSEEEEQASYDAEKAIAEKQRQDELAQQQELELEQRKVKAQEEAEANRRRTWRPGGWPYQPIAQ